MRNALRPITVTGLVYATTSPPLAGVFIPAGKPKLAQLGGYECVSR
jgi:hypothetical protein